jgi:hypothetical protein
MSANGTADRLIGMAAIPVCAFGTMFSAAVRLSTLWLCGTARRPKDRWFFIEMYRELASDDPMVRVSDRLTVMVTCSRRRAALLHLRLIVQNS